MRRPIITLTTDFGLSDHFAGTMKGVILVICPSAEIVDIGHEVGAFAVTEGAVLLPQAYRYFPRGTVHTVVVDPGVGTPRRPILAEAAGMHPIVKLARNYAECAPGELFVIVGSAGYLEISSSQASAAKMLGCGVGAPVELRIL